MKAGTSFLYSSLIEHPQICPCVRKEPEFFSTRQGHGLDADSYEDLWDWNPEQHQYRLEASTGYTKYPNEKGIPERMQAYGLDPKFIYIVRDPIDRIESDYNFRVYQLGMEGGNFLDPTYINISKYYRQLDQYLTVYSDRSRYLILDFDALVQRPNDSLQKCVRFLGIDDHAFSSKRAKNATPKTASDLWIKRLGLFAHRIGRLMPDASRAAVRRVMRLFTPSVRYEMDKKERLQARKLLHSDMQAFQSTFGFDVSKWGF
jgi:hypothetical protein